MNCNISFFYKITKNRNIDITHTLKYTETEIDNIVDNLQNIANSSIILI